MPEESKGSTPRPTFLRTAIVVGAAVAAALGGGIAIAANAPAPRQVSPTPTTTAAPAADFVGIPPVRVLDTRNAAGGPIGISPGHKLAAGETIDVAVAGVGGVPTEASSVAINITIDDDATLKSFLTVWPTGQPKPNTSANNAEPGLVSPNSAIFQVGTGGKLSVFNQQGAVNVVIDVTGYFIGSEEVPTTTTTVPGETTTTTTTEAPGTPTVALLAPSDNLSYAQNEKIVFVATDWAAPCGTFVNVTVDANTTTIKTIGFQNPNFVSSLLAGLVGAGPHTLTFTSNGTPACTFTTGTFTVKP